MFKIYHKDKVLRIYTPYPGQMIGFKGVWVEEARLRFVEMLQSRKIDPEYRFELVEVTPGNFWVDYKGDI